jgi:hypothetical protein
MLSGQSNAPILPIQIKVYDLNDKSLWHNRFATRLTDYFRRSNNVTIFNAKIFLQMVDGTGAFEIKPSEKFESNLISYRSPQEHVRRDQRIILEEMENALAYTTAHAIDMYGFETFKRRIGYLSDLAFQ